MRCPTILDRPTRVPVFFDFFSERLLFYCYQIATHIFCTVFLSNTTVNFSISQPVKIDESCCRFPSSTCSGRCWDHCYSMEFWHLLQNKSIFLFWFSWSLPNWFLTVVSRTHYTSKGRYNSKREKYWPSSSPNDRFWPPWIGQTLELEEIQNWENTQSAMRWFFKKPNNKEVFSYMYANLSRICTLSFPRFRSKIGAID